MSRTNAKRNNMNKSFEFLNAVVLSDDELLVINGGQNEITCGSGCGVGCGAGCGAGCTGCSNGDKEVIKTQDPSTLPT